MSISRAKWLTVSGFERNVFNACAVCNVCWLIIYIFIWRSLQSRGTYTLGTRVRDTAWNTVFMHIGVFMPCVCPLGKSLLNSWSLPKIENRRYSAVSSSDKQDAIKAKSSQADYCEWSRTFNTLRTGLLNYLNERSRGLTFRHRASCI